MRTHLMATAVLAAALCLGACSDGAVSAAAPTTSDTPAAEAATVTDGATATPAPSASPTPTDTSTPEPSPSTAPTPSPAPTPAPSPSPSTAPAPVRDPQTFGVDVFDFGYDPDRTDVAAGDTVVWTHVGDVSHTVTFSDGGPDSGSLSGGDTFEVTFDQPGTFSYRCLFHSQMQGTVVVA